MYGRTTLLALAFLAAAAYGFSPRSPVPTGSVLRGPGPAPLSRILLIYRHADHLFRLPDATPSTDSSALAGFSEVIAELQKVTDFKDKDTLYFQAWLKKGILLDSRYDFAGARDCYSTALRFHPQTDSLGFVADVYVGASYYNLNNFDSANYFLLKAELLADRFHDQEDEVRLYNTLGVLYYDNGNYQQGKNYFNRALGIVEQRRPFDTASAVSIQTNIATSLYHLGLFPEALSIYNKVLSFHLFTGPIYMNMGMAYASLDKYGEALTCFRKVNAVKMPGVLNEMGYAEFQLHRPDSSALFLDQWKRQEAGGQGTSGQRNTSQPNAIDQGTNDLYRSDLLASQGQYRAALHDLQKAIIAFSRNFNNEDIFSNPSSFTGTFASYRLFDALFKKAVFFEQWYRAQPKEAYLAAADAAYASTLSILRYIEKSYDTDDAKLFLKKKNGEVYQGALTVCMDLYRLHPGDHYLEQAFAISERNKASVIIANLEQRNVRHTPGIEGLLQKERNIKYNIARLNVKSEEAGGTDEAKAMAEEKARYEIELSGLQKQLEKNDQYYRLKYDDASPGIGELQQQLGHRQALISFYSTAGPPDTAASVHGTGTARTAGALHIFMLTRSSFSYARVDSLPALRRDVEDWLTALTTTGNGRKFKGDAIGTRLYDRLIKPIQAALPHQTEWIIIPDGFLYFLPFESLPAGTGSQTLLETTTISYQFSSRLLIDPVADGAADASPGHSASPAADAPLSVLAFAPFASHGASFAGQATNAISPGAPDSTRFSSLPASGEEIAGLPGLQYIDSGATRERFLKEINQYPIIHLATHAVSSVNNAANSFIAFYPRKKALAEDCLFLEELYGLDMNSTRLVVISACETGQGELVSNEGVISLARAFAYAGAASTVSSLWKADDQSTSFILRKFYAYLQKGYTKPKALQQAKLDYLASDAINKSPAYWSHLVLFGNSQPLYTKKYPWKWGIIIMLSVLFFGVALKFLRIGRLF